MVGLMSNRFSVGEKVTVPFSRVRGWWTTSYEDLYLQYATQRR